jgi:hypothetical protein
MGDAMENIGRFSPERETKKCFISSLGSIGAARKNGYACKTPPNEVDLGVSSCCAGRTVDSKVKVEISPGS